MIEISKKSKLYRFYNKLAQLPVFKPLTPTYYGETQAFTDVCTFLRVTLFYIFIAFPVFLAFYLSPIFIIYGIYESIINSNVHPTIFLPLIFLVIISCGTVFILFIMSVAWLLGKGSKASFVNLIAEGVRAKHNKLCKIIKLKD